MYTLQLKPNILKCQFNGNYGNSDKPSGLCCQYLFLEVELRTWANSGITHRCACCRIFIKVDFRLRSLGFAFSYDPTSRTRPRQVNRIIGIDQVTCPAKHQERNSTCATKDQERSRLIREGRSCRTCFDQFIVGHKFILSVSMQFLHECPHLHV